MTSGQSYANISAVTFIIFSNSFSKDDKNETESEGFGNIQKVEAAPLNIIAELTLQLNYFSSVGRSEKTSMV